MFIGGIVMDYRSKGEISLGGNTVVLNGVP